MSTSEPKHRRVLASDAGRDPFREYWMRKREALILELTAVEKHMLPDLASPVWRLIEQEKQRSKEESRRPR